MTNSSLFSTIVKIRTLFFYLLILFFPTQLSRHFWPDYSYLNGLRVDYLSPSLYFTDLLIWGVLFFDLFSWLLRFKKNSPGEKKFLLWKLSPGFIFLLAWGFLGLETFWALNQTLALIKLIKIGEIAFVGYFFSRELGKSLNLKTTAILFGAGIIYESFLTIWQVIRQGSVGGLWWWLGERSFTASTPFISQAIINNELILRPYATLPHPNVLGGYLVVALFLILFLYQGFTNRIKEKENVFLIFLLTLVFLATILTLSRVALLVLLLSLFLLWLKNKTKILTLVFTLLLMASFGWYSVIWSRFTSLLDVDQQSYLIRLKFNDLALTLFNSHPFFGVGLNNFLLAAKNGLAESSQIVRFLQPAHDIYLLIAAETGLLGILLWGLLFFCAVKKIASESKTNNAFNLKIILLGQFLIFGLFDHYLYTLQQGLLLSSFIFGAIFSRTLNNSK
ncbi:O-antigen ligase family protein [Candidatus Microgenomates bacterium]|nr:O-antigen ligase family protein [Candidatus Microgenomates bacterium]